MHISFLEISTKLPKASPLLFLIGEDKKFPQALMALDKKAGGIMARAIADSKFAGKKKQFLSVPGIQGCGHISLIGIGKPADFKKLDALNLGGMLVDKINVLGVKTATLVLDLPKTGNINLIETATKIGFGAQLKSYRFNKYHTKQKAENKPTFESFTIAMKGAKNAIAAYKHFNSLAEGIYLARNLITEPANVLYPKAFANECKKLAKLGIKIKVLGEAEMKKLGMNSLLGVGQGSVRESQLVVMQWSGISSKIKGQKIEPLAFVGKGVCFDTGGISIKPASGMGMMKRDMAGAAAVTGLLYSLAKRKAKINVVGVIGLVENMPDGDAIRPGDILHSMSGQTIEVLNTDAEGRLVLADALWYAQTNFKPRLVIDLATLTGAIVTALGTSRAGLFSNDDKLANQIFEAGKKSGEEVWRLPLAEVYDKQINSEIADVQNLGSDSEAGSIVAAQFLQRFIKPGTPWAHLDIAGMAWSKKELDTCPKGATAYGIQLLDKLISEYYERK